MYIIHEATNTQTNTVSETYYYGSVKNFQSSDSEYYSNSYILQSSTCLKTYGFRVCSPDYRMVNHFVNRYVIHYIIEGRAWCNGISVEAGDCIFFAKAEPYNFSADPNNPPTYGWITFRGGRSEAYLEHLGLTKKLQFFKSQRQDEILNVFHDMMYVCHKNEWEIEDFHLEACFLRLLALSKPSQKASDNLKHEQKSRRVYDAIKYITKHYNNPDLRIGTIASAVHTNEKYLSKIFKKETGMSIQQYINKTRIHVAVQLLCESNYNINEIAEFVGYNDRRNFTDMFKKQFGVPPSKYNAT